MNTLAQWLDGITLTLPITVDDMRELYALIKKTFPGAIVDAHAPHPTQAIVTVELEGQRAVKVYDAATST